MTSTPENGPLADANALLDGRHRLPPGLDIQPILDESLRTAAAVSETDMGLLSLCNADGLCLNAVASLGFDKEFLQAVGQIPPGGGACGTCFQRRQRVVVEDTQTDPVFTPYREAARRAGFRSIHSTPLLTRSGRIIGVLSTHAREPRRPSERETHLMDLCARQVVDAIENARLYRLAQEEIAERRRVEEALRESEERHRTLADNLPSGFIYQIVHGADDSRRFSYISGGVGSLCGVQPDEVIANPANLYGLIVPEDQARVRAEEDACNQRRQPFDCQFRIHSRDGQVRWLHCRSAPRSLPDGSSIWDGIAVDITERKRAEGRLEAVLASIDDHLVCYDRHWRYTFVNDKAAQILRMPKEALLGRSIWELFPDAIGNEYYLQLHRAVAEQRPVRFTFYYEPFATWFENHAYPTPDGVTVYSADVTWRMHMEQELRLRVEQLAEADRRKDEFLAMLAHELRNPLAPIRNALHILGVPDVPAEIQAHARDMMQRQIAHMARLVEDLLDVSRVTRGKITLKKERVDLSTAITRAVELTLPAVRARQHELNLSLPREPVRLVADPARIEQVFVNVLTNAAKYTLPGGHITVSVARDQDMAEVRVRDNGVGITAELLPRVFDLFVQAEQGSDRSQGGLGIGLTLVRSLVEMHGGCVEAHSDGPGCGSEFLVRLPCTVCDGMEQGQGTVTPGRSAVPRRVLVVDDNRDSAESMGWLLQMHGHEVRTAWDGAMALATVETFHPEVVFLDIGLPGMDGYEVARRLRARENGTRALLIAVTGYGQDEDRRRSLAAGFDHHLVKPPDPAALERILSATKGGMPSP